jgi:HD-GYP domain-containing protein (c-di-GMP phosphodiesterase class II)
VKKDQTLRKLLFSIATLEELGEVLGSQEEFRANLRMALYSVMGSLPVSKGALFLYEASRRMLFLGAARGVVLKEDLCIPLTGQLADALGRRRRVIVVKEASARMLPAVKRAGEVLDAVGGEIMVPVNFRGELIGLICLGPKFNGEKFSAEDFDLLGIMANYIAIGIHNQDLFRHLESRNEALRKKATQNRKLYRDLEGLYNDTIKALGAAIDAKDPYTRGHSDRVASFAEAIAKRLGMKKQEVAAVRIASHLHDIGKIAIDNSVLLKPSRLNEGEMDQIYRHPTISYDILSNIRFPYPDVALIARHHHEWVNGGGYPDRISTEGLNTGMKILSLADAFDAMTSDRPYRPALGLDVALKEVWDNVHVQFDPRVSKAFFGIIGDEIEGKSSRPAIIPRIRSRYVPKSIRKLLGNVARDLDRAATGAISA